MAKDYKLKFLGRGSAFNTKEKNTSAYIKKKDTMLLLDCGETVFSSLLENDILIGIYNLAIAITHLHPDHVGSLGSLLMYCKDELGIVPTLIYPNTLIKHMLEAQGIHGGYILTDYIENGIPELNISSITYFASRSMDEISSYSYKISSLTDLFIYYTGVINNEKDIFKIIQDETCHALYIDTCGLNSTETSRMSLDKLCGIVAQDQRGKVFCMHLDNDESITECMRKGFNVVTI